MLRPVTAANPVRVLPGRFSRKANQKPVQGAAQIILLKLKLLQPKDISVCDACH